MLSQRTLIDALAITAAITASVENEISGLYGVKSLVMETNFVYGSSGTTCKVWLQTSLDGGTNWIDVIQHDFATTSARKVSTIDVDAAATAVTPTDAALGADAIVDGILGDRWRVKVTTTGTYAGSTTLSVHIVPKGA